MTTYTDDQCTRDVSTSAWGAASIGAPEDASTCAVVPSGRSPLKTSMKAACDASGAAKLTLTGYYDCSCQTKSTEYVLDASSGKTCLPLQDGNTGGIIGYIRFDVFPCGDPPQKGDDGNAAAKGLMSLSAVLAVLLSAMVLLA